MFTKVFAISSDASNNLGSSSKLTIRFQLESCLVLSVLISLYVSEKKATSAPDTKKDITNKKMMIMPNNVEPGRLTANNIGENRLIKKQHTIE